MWVFFLVAPLVFCFVFFRPHPETIAAMLLKQRVSFGQLKVRHYAMLKLEKLMLGAAPNTDAYLAIYPTGLRTSMLLVPNLLNIPHILLGTATPSSVIGVAMHYSSRASKSRYCSLHTACTCPGIRRFLLAEKSSFFTAEFRLLTCHEAGLLI